VFRDSAAAASVQLKIFEQTRLSPVWEKLYFSDPISPMLLYATGLVYFQN